eukprot:1008250_1
MVPVNSERRTLSYNQISRLREVLDTTCDVHGMGNFPTLSVRPLTMINAIESRLDDIGLLSGHTRLNGSAAGYVIGGPMATSVPQKRSSDVDQHPRHARYNDVDILFDVSGFARDDSHRHFDAIRVIVLDCLRAFFPQHSTSPGGSTGNSLSMCALSSAYVQKMFKEPRHSFSLSSSSDCWSLISLRNEFGRNIELKFVHTLRRRYLFSIDSFQIVLEGPTFRALNTVWAQPESKKRRRRRKNAPKSLAKSEVQRSEQSKRSPKKCLELVIKPCTASLSHVSSSKSSASSSDQSEADAGSSSTNMSSSSSHAGSTNSSKMSCTPSNVSSKLSSKPSSVRSYSSCVSSKSSQMGSYSPSISSKASGSRDMSQATTPVSSVSRSMSDVSSRAASQASNSSSRPATRSWADLVKRPRPPTDTAAAAFSPPAIQPLMTPIKSLRTSKPLPFKLPQSDSEPESVLSESGCESSVSSTQRSSVWEVMRLSRDRSTSEPGRESSEDDDKPTGEPRPEVQSRCRSQSQTEIKSCSRPDTKSCTQSDTKSCSQSDTKSCDKSGSTSCDKSGSTSCDKSGSTSCDKSGPKSCIKSDCKSSRSGVQSCSQSGSKTGSQPDCKPSNESESGEESDEDLPEIFVESVYEGGFDEAFSHLLKHKIVLLSPESVRGGGLLKYTNLMLQGFRTLNARPARLESYMVTRFCIDYESPEKQWLCIASYVNNHFSTDLLRGRAYMNVLSDLARRSDVSPSRTFVHIVRQISQIQNHQLEEASKYQQWLTCSTNINHTKLILSGAESANLSPVAGEHPAPISSVQPTEPVRIQNGVPSDKPPCVDVICR